jgi:hypothetical protein
MTARQYAFSREHDIEIAAMERIPSHKPWSAMYPWTDSETEEFCAAIREGKSVAEAIPMTRRGPHGRPTVSMVPQPR